MTIENVKTEHTNDIDANHSALIDVHCHLEWPSFTKKLDNVINNAKQAGLIRIITSSVTPKDIKRVFEISERYPNYVTPICGLAPSEFKKHPDNLDKFLNLIEKRIDEIPAIGEVGLDYYWIKDKPTRKIMEEGFIKIIEFANRYKKPIVIHCRDAEQRTIELIEEYYSADTVHMHCFSGPPYLIKRGLKNGWLFSIPTSAINRSYHKKLAETVPLERMMLETDAPFLSPIKGQRMNEPKNIKLTAKFIAEMKGVSFEEVARITTANAKKFYSL